MITWMNPFKLFFSRHRVPLHVHTGSLTGLDYNEITDGIYIGTNQCCTLGLSDVLKREHIQCDISLEEKKIDQPYGVEVYVWIPIKDHFVPSLDQLRFGVDTLKSLVSQKKKIYIHCKNGHGRSSTLMCAYLMKARAISFEEAFGIIKQHRPGAHMKKPQIDLLLEGKFLLE